MLGRGKGAEEVCDIERVVVVVAVEMDCIDRGRVKRIEARRLDRIESKGGRGREGEGEIYAEKERRQREKDGNENEEDGNENEEDGNENEDEDEDEDENEEALAPRE